MNIDAVIGSKVVFTQPEHGYPNDKKMAQEHLEIGQTYTIHNTIIDEWNSLVYFDEVPGLGFNCSMFEDFDEYMAADPEDVKTGVDNQTAYLRLYTNAINQIDDYFEYSHESEKDKNHVMGVIDKLTKQLKEV